MCFVLDMADITTRPIPLHLGLCCAGSSARTTVALAESLGGGGAC